VPGPACLGLTGGIGSGKSAALDAFGRRGAAVLSSDAVVHRLYDDDEVIAAVRARFGDDVLSADGRVDRAVLGPRAFGDPEAMAFLEALLFPRISIARTAWIAEQRALPTCPPVLVCEVPLLFEAGLRDAFDAVLVVTAPESVRRARVEARGQQFDERRARQVDEDAKVAAADASYVNDGTMEQLEAWVDAVMARYGTPAVDGTP
jgi:dephospho-CoA kinase